MNFVTSVENSGLVMIIFAIRISSQPKEYCSREVVLTAVTAATMFAEDFVVC